MAPQRVPLAVLIIQYTYGIIHSRFKAIELALDDCMGRMLFCLACCHGIPNTSHLPFQLIIIHMHKLILVLGTLSWLWMVAWGIRRFVLLVVTAPQHVTLVKALELALDGRMGCMLFCRICCH